METLNNHGHTVMFHERATGNNSIPSVLPETALVFNASNTPAEREQAILGGPWKNCISGFCGIHHLERKTFRVAADSTPQNRGEWLPEIRKTIAKHFPANSTSDSSITKGTSGKRQRPGRRPVNKGKWPPFPPAFPVIRLTCIL